MSDGHDPQMLKGVLALLLLRLLAGREDYGYALVVRLQELGFGGLSEGTVYPALTRLEAQGLLEARLVRSSSGPARKYYRPTDAGREEMTRAEAAWHELTAAVEQVVGTPGAAAAPRRADTSEAATSPQRPGTSDAAASRRRAGVPDAARPAPRSGAVAPPRATGAGAASAT